MDIRLANINDIKNIYEINRHCLIANYTIDDLTKLLDLDTAAIFVCDVGYVIVMVKYDFRNRPYSEITSLAVMKEYRRRNIATKLLLEAEKFAKSINRRELRLYVRESNIGAQKLYEKNGFCKLKKFDNFYNLGTSLDGTIYKKEDGFLYSKYIL